MKSLERRLFTLARGVKLQQPALADGAGRSRARAGRSAPRAAGAANLPPHGGAAGEGPPPPPPRLHAMLAGQPAFEGTWEEMGEMETARRLSGETRKQKPATTDLDYSILLV